MAPAKMTLGDQSEQLEQTVTRIVAGAIDRGAEHAARMTGGDREGSRRELAAGNPLHRGYFTYGFARALAGTLQSLPAPVAAAYVLPEGGDGDPRIQDILLVADRSSAALRSLCDCLESQFTAAAAGNGLPLAIRLHVVATAEITERRGMGALIGALHGPALPVRP